MASSERKNIEPGVMELVEARKPFWDPNYQQPYKARILLTRAAVGHILGYPVESRLNIVREAMKDPEERFGKSLPHRPLLDYLELCWRQALEVPSQVVLPKAFEY